MTTSPSSHRVHHLRREDPRPEPQSSPDLWQATVPIRVARRRAIAELRRAILDPSRSAAARARAATLLDRYQMAG